jgi:RNA polymerase sigma-70 factor (ECF subfamily)
MTGPTLDVGDCLAAIARGEEDGARALVERCHPLVARIVRAHRPRTVPEEDLAQEVFLKMFGRLDRYEPRAGVPFEHWLSRLAVRTCLDALRAEGRRPQATACSLGPDGEAWLAALHGRAEPPVAETALAARELVEALLLRLPPDDRLVLSLLDLEERTVEEVSRLTGWSRGLVRVRAFRARRRLRTAAMEVDRLAGRPGGEDR